MWVLDFMYLRARKDRAYPGFEIFRVDEVFVDITASIVKQCFAEFAAAGLGDLCAFFDESSHRRDPCSGTHLSKVSTAFSRFKVLGV